MTSRLHVTLLLALFWAGSPDASGQIGEQETAPLPRGLTPAERLLLRFYIPPASGPAIAPPGPVRAMAEFEELEGLVIRWAYGTYNLLLSQIVDAAQDEGTVWILVRPSTSDSSNIKSYLAGRGIPLTNLVFLAVSTNSVWSRDYGPWTVYDTATDSMAIVDFRYNRPRPLDDLVPSFLASEWSLPLHQTTAMPDSLVFTGGNFMVDGFGTGFASRLVNDENLHLDDSGIDTILARYCGLTRFVKMQTLLHDVIHHIDMHMKLLDEETLLIGAYPPGQGDHDRIEATVDSLRLLPNCYGRPYRIIRIPMPSDNAGNYPPASYYLTYTNSIIVNRTVLVPLYGRPEDADALRIYREAMPGYRVLGYDCNAIIPASGAIHCITKEVGVRHPVLIAHARYNDAPASAMRYRIDARVTSRAGVDSVLLFWRADSALPFQRVALVESSDVWTGVIPRQSPGVTVGYFLSVRTASGRTVTKPLVGAAGPYTFTIGPPAVVSLPLHTGWNLLSLPVEPDGDSVAMLFPTALSPAYAFGASHGYVPQTTLGIGTGYWLKFGSEQAADLTGIPRDQDTISVQAGWNMIGALLAPVAVQGISSIPPGIIASGVYAYAGAYTAVDTLRAGSGYWLKVSEDGELVLTASSGGRAHAAARPALK